MKWISTAFPTCAKVVISSPAPEPSSTTRSTTSFIPLDQQTHSRELRVSPFYLRLQELGAQFIFQRRAGSDPTGLSPILRLLDEYDVPPRHGWEAKHWSPIQGAEHLATRDRVALYDLTPFAKFEITGPGVVEYLQSLCANDRGQARRQSHLHRHAGRKRRHHVRLDGESVGAREILGRHGWFCPRP
jgi:hypothetical protein